MHGVYSRITPSWGPNCPFVPVPREGNGRRRPIKDVPAIVNFPCSSRSTTIWSDARGQKVDKITIIINSFRLSAGSRGLRCRGDSWEPIRLTGVHCRPLLWHRLTSWVVRRDRRTKCIRKRRLNRFVVHPCFGTQQIRSRPNPITKIFLSKNQSLLQIQYRTMKMHGANENIWIQSENFFNSLKLVHVYILTFQ